MTKVCRYKRHAVTIASSGGLLFAPKDCITQSDKGNENHEKLKKISVCNIVHFLALLSFVWRVYSLRSIRRVAAYGSLVSHVIEYNIKCSIYQPYIFASCNFNLLFIKCCSEGRKATKRLIFGVKRPEVLRIYKIFYFLKTHIHDDF